MEPEEFRKQYGMHLNDQQWEAVRCVDGAVLVLAVPGSGKTTVLVTRLGYMVCCCGISPSSILTMTYTVAATREMGARFARMFGSGYGNAMQIRTINGLSQKIIDFYSQTTGRDAFRLLDDDAQLASLVRRIYGKYYEEYPSESVIRDLRTAITFCKNRMMTREEIGNHDVGLRHFRDIYEEYCEALRIQRLMDYDDQMLYALNILKKRPEILTHFRQQYPYICVDESQDTSHLQHEIIALLSEQSGNLFMVGDEDQSIYGFRAADPDALVNFEKDHPGARTLMLEQNYRSTGSIIAAANSFVSRNRYRHPKVIRTDAEAGTPVRILPAENRKAQYRYLIELAARNDRVFTVLYRNNDSAIPLIDRLERDNIPYRCKAFDEVFFAHRVLNDITDIIHFSQNPLDEEAFLRIYYKLDAAIPKTAALYACAESRKTGKPILRELIRCPELSQSAMSRITELYGDLEQLPRDSAVDGLSRIRYTMGYGKYVEERKLDAGKFSILEMVAEPLDSLAALLDRLEDLRLRIRDHVDPPDAWVTLSTIHSSKGLEYDTVYLLDAYDGILPAQQTAPETDRQYQEDRRLFYVAITRARQELYLFRVQKEKNSFVDEIRRSLPSESFDDCELMSFLGRDPCGMRYRHRILGPGTVAAGREELLLIHFRSGQFRLMDLCELAGNRQILTAAPAQKERETAGAGSSGSELAADARVIHTHYGIGTVTKLDSDMVTVRFDSDQRERSFLKSAVLPNGKLKRAEEKPCRT